MLIGFAGKKQSGKNTCCSLITAFGLLQKNLVEEASVLNDGKVSIPTYDPEIKKDCTITVDLQGKNPETIDFLQKCVWPVAKVYSFADKLKYEVCHKLLEIDLKALYGSDDEKNKETHILWENMPGVAEPDWSKGEFVYPKTGPMTTREVLEYVGTEVFRHMYPTTWLNALRNQLLAEKNVVEKQLVCDVRFPNEIAMLKELGGIIIYLTRTQGESNHSSNNSIDESTDGIDYIIDNTDEKFNIEDNPINMVNLTKELEKIGVIK